jgi:serine/threonine-protein kinase ULK/ATG1
MGGANGEIDPMEDVLLEGLEQLAQKTHVITRWADEMYEFVKSVPQSASFLLVSFLPLLAN